eukprot:TRINITY_DN12389_c0_g1_i1.p1 TRINITY_DN12389_c0_g1~~TRINITY_DN12389_c0_g1_i1.p1  ORF type:complete len:496 (+),score=108.31 TRINITY_DN12389_c0_g1_i1:76-1563(+)
MEQYCYSTLVRPYIYSMAARDDLELAGRTIEDFTLGQFLANGSFCEVVEVTDRVTGKRYAMKMVAKKRSPVDQACVMEAHCLRRLAASPFVISLLFESDGPAQWRAVLEFCEGGELWAQIQNCGCCAEGEFAWYGSQMVHALAAVHDAGIVHRDVKCENFLIAADRSLKIIDFGTARDTQHSEVKTMVLGPQYEHHVGTPNFMAPEVVRGKANDQRSDMWSLGCSLFQLLTGAPPFSGCIPFLILQKTEANMLTLPASGVADAERDLMRTLLQTNPEDRLGATNTRAILEHSLFSGSPARPSPSPAEDPPLVQGLRRVGRAVAGEAAAALAADEKAEAAKSGEAGMMFLGGGTGHPATAGAQEPGAEMSSLLKELPGILGIGSDASPSDRVGEAALLRAVNEAASSAADAPREFAEKLADAAAGLSDVAVAGRLRLFSEMSARLLAEAKETPDFGGGDNSDEDEDEDEDEARSSEEEIKVEEAEGTVKRCCPSLR